MKQQVKIINRSGNELPEYQTPQSAGMDVRARLEAPVTIKPLERVMIPTGLYVELPDGYEMQVRPRSGLAAKHGITVLNSPGTIDADYRGEIKVILVNLSDTPFTIEHGERIAQLVVTQYTRVCWQPSDSLSESERGEGGFGSTNTK